MKKRNIVLNTAVAAAFVAMANNAMATITLSDTTADARTYASEIATNGMTISDTNLDARTVMGFGVSSGQTRYVRFDLTNGKFATQVVAADLDAGISPAGTSYTPGVAVAAGGSTSDSYVIFQVTADVNYASSDSFSLSLGTGVGGVVVTAAGTDVGLTYALYETASDAVNNTSTGRLATQTETIAKFGAGLKYSVTTNTSTAIVADAYKKFTSSALTAKLGTVVYGVNTAYTGAGVLVATTDLVTAATKLVVAGNFGAADTTSTPNSIWLNTTADDCASGAEAQGTLNTAKTSADVTIGTTAFATGAICYTVTGTTVVPVQTTTVALDLTAAAGSTAADVAAQTLGNIAHDGAELESPWFSTAAGYESRFVLSNAGTSDVPYTTTVRTENGNACTAGSAATGTIPAGKQIVIQAANICSAFTAGQPTRGGVTFTIAAPNNTVQGVYNLINYASGASSVSNLVRPGTN